MSSSRYALEIKTPLQRRHIFVNQPNQITVKVNDSLHWKGLSKDHATQSSSSHFDLSKIQAKLFFAGERKNEVRSATANSSAILKILQTSITIVHDKPAAKRPRTSFPGKLLFTITETSMLHHNRSFVIQIYLPGNTAVAPVYTNPFKVITYMLKACQPLDPIFYKDKGGKRKCMKLVLRLEDSYGKPISGLTFPLSARLVYSTLNTSHPQPPQEILEIMNPPLKMLTTGFAQVDFRINDVSRNHLSQKFGLIVGPDPNLLHKHKDVGPACSSFVEVLSKKNPGYTRNARKQRQQKKQLPKPVMDLYVLGGNSFSQDLLPNDEMSEQPAKCLETMDRWNRDAFMLLQELSNTYVGTSPRCLACSRNGNPHNNHHFASCPIKHLIDYHNRYLKQCGQFLHNMLPPQPQPLDLTSPTPSASASASTLTSLSTSDPSEFVPGTPTTSSQFVPPPMPDMTFGVSMVSLTVPPLHTPANTSSVKFIVAENVDASILPPACQSSLTRMPAYDADKHLVGLYLDETTMDFPSFMRLVPLSDLNLSDQAITKCEHMIHDARVTLHSLDDHLDDMRELEETAYAQLNSTDDNFSSRTDAQFAYLGI